MKNLVYPMLAASLLGAGPTYGAGDPEEGARVFRVCVACHSLNPGDHRTGPSLAGIWGRTAGSIADFSRYSEALAESEIVWTAETLDRWIAEPQAMVPGNRMSFPGIEDRQARADLIAYLEQATAPDAAQAARQSAQQPRLPDLGTVEPEQRVTGIRYCGDGYRINTADGQFHSFWEFNLRFKTDSSDRGPEPGQPVLITAGMMGDRAFVVFASPEEISQSIERDCPNQ